MATLGEMSTRIIDELGNRTELATQITRAITSAIDFFDEQRFWFNEAIGTFATVSGQEWYTSSDFAPLDNGISQIDSLRIEMNNSIYLLLPRSPAEIESFAQGIEANADPTEWTYYRGQIRLWPIPNAARTVTVAYVARLGTPADSASSNAWTTEAEELIRTHAKIDILESVIRGAEEFAEADRLRRREMDILFNLRRKTARLTSSGRILPSEF